MGIKIKFPKYSIGENKIIYTTKRIAQKAIFKGDDDIYYVKYPSKSDRSVIECEF